jgi:taurine dioxygenase
VLLFRGRRITRDQQIAFGRQFGELERYTNITPDQPNRDAAYPELYLINNKVNPLAAGYKGFEVWHSDFSFTTTPAMASILRCLETPEVGGNTMFTNMYLAYNTLSDGMKKLLEGLHGIHVGGGRRADNEAAQPIVRVHPETGRKALFVTEKVEQLVGLTKEESRPLLKFLMQHGTRPQFIYRHQWQPNDILMWDNRCTNHIAVGDYDDQGPARRIMERIIVKGQPSGYLYKQPAAA